MIRAARVNSDTASQKRSLEKRRQRRKNSACSEPLLALLCRSSLVLRPSGKYSRIRTYVRHELLRKVPKIAPERATVFTPPKPSVADSSKRALILQEKLENHENTSDKAPSLHWALAVYHAGLLQLAAITAKVLSRYPSVRAREADTRGRGTVSPPTSGTFTTRVRGTGRQMGKDTESTTRYELGGIV